MLQYSPLHPCTQRPPSGLHLLAIIHHHLLLFLLWKIYSASDQLIELYDLYTHSLLLTLHLHIQDFRELHIREHHKIICLYLTFLMVLPLDFPIYLPIDCS